MARRLGRRDCLEIVEIVSDAPAARAGLRVGDLVVALGEAAVEDVPTLQRLMVGELIDTPTTITVARDDQLLELSLVAAELTA
jgi:S1-C subfamily serine protease